MGLLDPTMRPYGWKGGQEYSNLTDNPLQERLTLGLFCSEVYLEYLYGRTLLLGWCLLNWYVKGGVCL